jgi:queuosine precursor transporter
VRNRPVGAALFTVYIGSVVLANWLTTRYGLVPAGFGLLCPAGTFAIGGVIMTRDLLQDAAGRIAVLAAIVIGAGLSFLVSSHQIAAASAVTFLIAESLEFAVYTPLRRRTGWGSGRWAGVIAVANVTGALADTLIFLHLAGFPVTWSTVGGQMLGKAYVTAAVVAAGLIIRRALKPAAVTA